MKAYAIICEYGAASIHESMLVCMMLVGGLSVGKLE